MGFYSAIYNHSIRKYTIPLMIDYYAYIKKYELFATYFENRNTRNFLANFIFFFENNNIS